MRVAALYDIHGNVPALESVLADVASAGVDAILIGGDVAEGPQPGETLDRLEAVDIPLRWIRGDCDREPSEWVTQRLDERHVTWLTTLPPIDRIDVRGCSRADLQALIERNLETVLGVRLLESEYSTGGTHGGRIDSLDIDENNAPVIVEYMRATNENVINQGLYYLDWLLDHRAEFTLLVMKRLGADVASGGQPCGHTAGGGGAASQRALEPPSLFRGHV